ncbi:MAG TPA: glycosyltransferase family 4 protein [Chloroflexota bacterium]|nr:glycosyltransferase family 4 protein [Chloroflexota bacterium]
MPRIPATRAGALPACRLLAAATAPPGNAPLPTAHAASAAPEHDGAPRPRIALVRWYDYRADSWVRRQAAALLAHGYAVDVVCPRAPGEPAHEQVAGVTVWRVGGTKYRGGSITRYALAYLRFLIAALGTLARLHRQHPYAAVQVYSMPESLVIAALGPRLAGVPLIYAAGDLTTELYAAKFGRKGSRLIAAALRLQERVCLGLADLVLTVHEEYRRRLLARGVPAAKLRVVLNLPDERLFFPRPRPAAGRDGAAAEEFRLVYHGTLVERYGVDLAVEAVALLRARIPGLRLMIYGDGELRPRLADLIARRGLSAHVALSPGYLPVDALPPLLAAADVALVPTRASAFTETILPTKLLEYLALGLPTIATRTRTVVAHVPPEAVEYCAPDDAEALAAAILRLWENPARRQALAAGAQRWSAAHRWADAAAVYCAAVDALVAARGGRPPPAAPHPS